MQWVAGRALSAKLIHPIHGNLRQQSLYRFSALPYNYFHTSSCNNTVVQFKLSDIGEGITEVTVKEWFVKVGDKVAQFDNICEVQSDKASVTITSRYDGVIKKLYYEVDEVARVGQPLVDIDGDGDVEVCVSEPVADLKESSPVESFNLNTKVLATPAVRRIALEHKIDIGAVKGTGKSGRVMKEDILAHIGQSHPAPSQIPPPAQVVAKSHPTAYSPDIFSDTDRTEPVTGFAKTMVKTMTAANAVPHVVYSDEVSVLPLVHLRKELKHVAHKKNIKLTYMPFFIKAASQALLQYPILNATVNSDCSEIMYKANHNIGFAMDSPLGLIVPNIKDVRRKRVFEIAQELNNLIAAGMNGNLSPKDITGGTFSISNIGAIGGTYMKPVLLVPEVAIGALGRFQKLPRFNSHGQVEEAQIMCVSWAADHRIIDGATIARFSNVFKELIENPIELLLL